MLAGRPAFPGQVDGVAGEVGETPVLARRRVEVDHVWRHIRHAGLLERSHPVTGRGPIPTARRTISIVFCASARAFFAPWSNTSSTYPGRAASSLRFSRKGPK